MKKNIHPAYYNTKVACACGNTFTVGSTMTEIIKVEVCYACHPFYTGKQKILDSAGRVDKFKQRTQIAQKKQDALKKKGLKKQDDDKETVVEAETITEEPATVIEVEGGEKEEVSTKKSPAVKKSAVKKVAKKK